MSIISQFTSSCLTGITPLNIDFVTVTPSITGVAWDFGDGTTLDHSANTSHEYSSGTYLGNLQVFDASGNIGTRDFIVNCLYSGFNYVNQWDWDFGDGSAHDNTQVTSHIYNVSGGYNINLTITDNAGAVATKSFYAYAFTDNHPSVTNYHWVFGDGGADDGQSLTHIYNDVGGFLSTLTVTDSNSSTASKSFNVYTLLVRNMISQYEWYFGDGTSHEFTQSVTHQFDVTGNYLVTLINTTDGTSAYGYYPVEVFSTWPTINQWLWTFGDGSTSTDQNPSHIFSSGNYLVSQQIWDTNSSTSIRTYPFEIFGTWPTINQWSWDFGDGSPIETTQNATHIYSDPGNYLVTYTCSDSTGTTITHRYAIEVLTPGFTWEWDFGELGTTSNLQNPTHIYTQKGYHTVTLRINHAETQIRIDYIYVTQGLHKAVIINIY